MVRCLASIIFAIGLSSCSRDVSIATTSSNHPIQKAMPDIFQSVTPSQQRAIMSGERPDWSELSPLPRTLKR